jgi:hypothetical protein
MISISLRKDPTLTRIPTQRREKWLVLLGFVKGNNNDKKKVGSSASCLVLLWREIIGGDFYLSNNL